MGTDTNFASLTQSFSQTAWAKLAVCPIFSAPCLGDSATPER